MKLKNRWNYSYIFMILAIIISLFTSIKVATNSLFWIDEKVTNLLSQTSDAVISFFIQVTELGDKKGIGLVALLTLAWLLLKKRNYLGAATFALSVALGNEASKFLKNLFVRPRPDLEHLVHVSSYSFPSGHAMVGTILYVFVAYLLIESTKSTKAKFFIGALAFILLSLIGASRIILHVHFPSDVLGGYALGYTWVFFWILLYTFLKKRLHNERG